MTAAQKEPRMYGEELSCLASVRVLKKLSLSRADRCYFSYVEPSICPANMHSPVPSLSLHQPNTTFSNQVIPRDLVIQNLHIGQNLLQRLFLKSIQPWPTLQIFLKSLKDPQTPNKQWLAAMCPVPFLRGPNPSSSGSQSQFTTWPLPGTSDLSANSNQHEITQ